MASIFNVAFSITGAIKGTCAEKRYQESNLFAKDAGLEDCVFS